MELNNLKKIKAMTNTEFKKACAKINVRVYSIRKFSTGWKISYCYILGPSTVSTQKDNQYFDDSLQQVFDHNFAN